jgi:hypothetical protein
MPLIVKANGKREKLNFLASMSRYFGIEGLNWVCPVEKVAERVYRLRVSVPPSITPEVWNGKIGAMD